jgi:uncharacterized protein
MVSLDSVGPEPDLRGDAYNRSSAGLAINGIEKALELGLVPEISVTISPGSSAHLPKLMKWVLEHNLPFSLNFYRPAVHRNVQTELILSSTELIANLKKAYAVIESNLPEHSLLNNLLDRVRLGGLHLRPCAVGQSYLVVDPHGGVARCQMEMDQRITTICAEDPLMEVRETLNGVQNPPITESDACNQCELRWWCSGGCPLTRTNTHSPSMYCRAYRALVPEVWRLEGLRLLKYGQPGIRFSSHI